MTGAIVAFPPSIKRLCAVTAACVACFTVSALGGTLYGTDFEAFPVGDNLWAGTEGWQSNDLTSGAQGILQDYVSNLPLGKTAYLGFNPPASAFTTVFRPVIHDPVASGIPIVEFDSFLGIQDSTNGRRDRFYISFYNAQGDFLAALLFDNLLGKVYREDGVARFDTGVPFQRGDPLFGFVALQVLYARIDLEENRWSASLDGIPLFDSAVFNAGSKSRVLGAVAAEWQVPGAVAGNNWLFVADWYVRSVPVGVEPFRISEFTRDNEGKITLGWQAQAGFDYQVWYSDDFSAWFDDLPGSAFPGITAGGQLSFTDANPPPHRRFYRVSRSVSP